jgi:hypothetical protein
VQVVRRPLCVRRCLKDGALVLLQDLKPGGDVAGVVLPRLQVETEVGGEEGRAELGDLSEQSSCLSGLSSAETSRSGGVARF